MFISTTHLWPYWLGFIYCSFYIFYPFIYSFLRIPKGMKWVPVNNQHRQPGDSKFFAACVQETRLNFFKHQHPCSKNIGNMAIDFTRVTSYRTAALLGLFVRDERVAIVLSFTFSILIQYTGIFMVSLIIFKIAWLALLIAFFFIFWVEVFTRFIKGKGSTIVDYVKSNLLNRGNKSYFEVINDNFRYVIMSVSGIYFWITLLLIFYTSHQPVDLFLFIFIYFIYFLIIPFVYPPTSLLSISILGTVILVECVRESKYEIMSIVLISGVSAFIVLLLTGVLKKWIDITRSDLSVLNSSHNKPDSSPKSMSRFLKAILTDPFTVVVISLLILLSFISRVNSLITVVLSIYLGFIIVGLLLRKIHLVYRFITRGGLGLIYFGFCAAIVTVSTHYGFTSAQIEGFSKISLVPLAIIPVMGVLRIAKSLQISGAFYLPTEEWEVYRYVKQKTLPRTNVLAFSFSNLQLIPVFTHANLYITGAEWLADPESELRKYARALMFIGKDPKLLKSDFEAYFPVVFKDYPCVENMLNERNCRSYHKINTLIYYPYVNQITGITLANESNTAWTKEFMSLVDDITESAMVRNNKEEIDHILLDLSEFNDVDNIDGYQVVLRNSSYILFSKV